MHFKKMIMMAAALTLLSCVSIAVAQDAEKNEGIAHVALITPKDGHNKALEEAKAFVTEWGSTYPSGQLKPNGKPQEFPIS